MQKGVEIIDKPLQVQMTGERLNRKIKNLVCDRKYRKIAGFWVEKLEGSNEIEFLPFSKIEALGGGVIAVSSKNAIVPTEIIPELQDAIAKGTDLRGKQFATQDGCDLGTILDLYFDPDTGLIQGYEVSGGMFADPKTEQTFVPATPFLEIRDRIIIVPSETVALMEEKDIQASASPTMASAAAQKAFMIGKIAREAVHTSNGTQLILPGQLITSAHAAVAENQGVLKQLYCAAGGNRVRPTQAQGKSLACIARPAILRARGRRVRKMVRTRAGAIVAALGEIVTEQTIERASTYCQEKALLEAVGLSIDESMELICVEIAPSMSTSVEGTKVWKTLKPTPEEKVEQEALTSREQEIRNILGYPVTQVIRDRDKQVILDIGDLITYQAVERARQAKTLDKLLNAVYE